MNRPMPNCKHQLPDYPVVSTVTPPIHPCIFCEREGLQLLLLRVLTLPFKPVASDPYNPSPKYHTHEDQQEFEAIRADIVKFMNGQT